MDNDDYFGYSGGRWYVIIILLERQGMNRPKYGWRQWIRKHDFEVNKLLAIQFTMFLSTEINEETSLRIWQHGHDWENNKILMKETDIYVKKVHWIEKYLTGKGEDL